MIMISNKQTNITTRNPKQRDKKYTRKQHKTVITKERKRGRGRILAFGAGGPARPAAGAAAVAAAAAAAPAGAPAAGDEQQTSYWVM